MSTEPKPPLLGKQAVAEIDRIADRHFAILTEEGGTGQVSIGVHLVALCYVVCMLIDSLRGHANFPLNSRSDLLLTQVSHALRALVGRMRVALEI